MQVQAYPSRPPSPAGSRQSMSIISTFLHLLLLALPIHGIDVDLDNDDSVVMTARVLAAGVRHYYTGDRPGGVPGYLPPPYYWWEAGAMFGSLIDYWFYTGDSTYNNIIIQAMLHQASETQNFMPANQTRVEGNDDQCFWALAAMAAAERRFTDPPPDQPQWLTLVQGTFNSQAARWDMETCGGGLKWQIFRFNKGFNYKNTISNGCFFNIAARLATYTNNHTYAAWAEKTWEWVQRIGLITPDYYFLDGTDDLKNCSQLNRNRWTYNAGIFMLGAAHMYQFTNGSEIWRTRLQNIINALHIFIHKGSNVLYEPTCEAHNKCTTDQLSFKAYLARWMAATMQICPFTTARLLPILRASAAGAASACTIGTNGAQCSQRWNVGRFEGSAGLGQLMAALEVIQGLLVRRAPLPVSAKTNGTSKVDVGAGFVRGDLLPEIATRPITVGDQIGAAILTAVFLGFILGGASLLL
ncbi:glycosyl hydrolase [Histoplasma capsulatum]|uniref:Mannan endo-1,6-alpha-mannosidase n=1 Tax=Ajellomyces capsulatus TaxID=5037 RepID=A0A8A1MSD9_AJECA|nr:glycosyl hydrolase [Histoplasma capsulatum]